MSSLEMGGRWLHKASGRVYTVVCNATHQSDFSRLVVSFDDDGVIWAWRTEFFIDGRMSRLK